MELDSEINGHLERCSELLNKLRLMGIDIYVARDINFDFILPSEDIANEVFSKLSKQGFALESISEVDEKDTMEWWWLTVSKCMSPTNASSREFIVSMVQLSSEWDGEFDGWGTSV
jgi:hypothetical protein